MPHALIIEDENAARQALSELVESHGFTTSTAGTLKEARRIAKVEAPDLVLIDLMLPDGSGIDFVREFKENATLSEIVMITGHASVDSAVEALRLGASDYLTKPVDVPRLKSVLANVTRTRELKGEVEKLRGELRKLGRFGSLLGVSPAMQRVYDLIAKVAPTDATVLITGESGTGKEVVAETLHSISPRHHHPFLPLNCSAVSVTLIESELFGHERGSFTGANRLHRGIFERAHGGTLFLDEITEMPGDLQAKLLRVLETGAFSRIGGEQVLEVDVRVLAATNRTPGEAVKAGKLREDLLYRLSVFPIHLPPLRERGEDVALLAEHFLATLNKERGTKKAFAKEALARFRDHAWPGNVRELKNVVQRAYIMAEGEIGPELLPGLANAPLPRPSGLDSNGSFIRVKVGSSIADAERQLITATLEDCAGDKRQAAEVLGISLKTLYNRLNAYRDEEEA
jgi:DNA-binding NtrC family response regulator